MKEETPTCLRCGKKITNKRKRRFCSYECLYAFHKEKEKKWKKRKKNK